MSTGRFSDLLGSLKNTFKVGLAKFDASGLATARTITLADAAGGTVPTVGAAAPTSPFTNQLWVPTGSPELTVTPSANQNDYAPTNLHLYLVLRLNPSADITITGLAATYAGHLLQVVNVSAFTVTFTLEDTGSSAANRFSGAGNAGVGVVGNILVPRGIMLAEYDGTSTRWRIGTTIGNRSGVYYAQALGYAMP